MRYPARERPRGLGTVPRTDRGRQQTVNDPIHRAIVVANVPCGRCRYELRGLPASGRCPECGLEVIETLTQLVDPEASGLPRLRDPRATGNGILGLGVTVLALGVVYIVPRIIEPLAVLFTVRGSPIRLPSIPIGADVIAAGIACLGLAWVWLVARSPAEEPAEKARRSIRMMFAGLALLAAALIVPFAARELGMRSRLGLLPLDLLALPFAIMFFRGFNGVLEVVGQRSRAFRNARGGRQGVDALLGAMVAAALGHVLRVVGRSANIEFLESIGTGLYTASNLLFLVGLLYLLVNCWWIRSALRRPPPRLEELLRVD